MDISSSCGSNINLPTLEGINSTIEIRRSVTQLNSILPGIKHVINGLGSNVWSMKMYALFLVGFVIVLITSGLVNICLKTSKRVQRTLSWGFIPILVLFILLSLVSSVIMSSIAIGNSGTFQ